MHKKPEPKTSEVYPELYHYTNYNGLHGILDSQKLWATHYKFLNDVSEISLFKKKAFNSVRPDIIKFIEDLISDGTIDAEKAKQLGPLEQIAEQDFNVFIEANYKATGEEIYITSFCGHKDEYTEQNGLLSQWRGYGKDGGFALVFDTKKIEDLLETEAKQFEYRTGHVSDVVYDGDEKKFSEDLLSHANEIAEYYKSTFLKFAGKEAPYEVENAFKAFTNCITRYKHKGFKEEKEVRIVTFPEVFNNALKKAAQKNKIILKKEKPRLFRGNIPYLELFNGNLPITRILVGPHKEKERRATELKVKLRNVDIEIDISDIPYAN